jgi:hypothetical protein
VLSFVLASTSVLFWAKFWDQDGEVQQVIY